MLYRNKFLYIFNIIIILFIYNIFINIGICAVIDTTDTINQGKAFIKTSKFNSAIEIGDIIALAIKGFLAILGILFIILMLTAGYNWMTAGGEEEKVTKAKDMIKRAIIGLFIVIASYAITAFVFKYLPWG